MTGSVEAFPLLIQKEAFSRFAQLMGASVSRHGIFESIKQFLQFGSVWFVGFPDEVLRRFRSRGQGALDDFGSGQLL